MRNTHTGWCPLSRLHHFHDALWRICCYGTAGESINASDIRLNISVCVCVLTSKTRVLLWSSWCGVSDEVSEQPVNAAHELTMSSLLCCSDDQKYDQLFLTSVAKSSGPSEDALSKGALGGRVTLMSTALANFRRLADLCSLYPTLPIISPNCCCSSLSFVLNEL